AYLESAVEAELLARLRAGDGGARDLVLRFGLTGGRTGAAVGLVTDFLARLGRTGRDAALLVEATASQAAATSDAGATLRAAADRIIAAVEARIERGGKGAGIDGLTADWAPFADLLRRVDASTPLEEFLTLRKLCRLLAGARL